MHYFASFVGTAVLDPDEDLEEEPTDGEEQAGRLGREPHVARCEVGDGGHGEEDGGDAGENPHAGGEVRPGDGGEQAEAGGTLEGSELAGDPGRCRLDVAEDEGRHGEDDEEDAGNGDAGAGERGRRGRPVSPRCGVGDGVEEVGGDGKARRLLEAEHARQAVGQLLPGGAGLAGVEVDGELTDGEAGRLTVEACGKGGSGLRAVHGQGVVRGAALVPEVSGNAPTGRTFGPCARGTGHRRFVGWAAVDALSRLAVAARSDEQARHEFVTAAYPDVWRLCAGLVGRDAADDLAQETFVRAVRALGGFRGDASARTWLLSIARHVCIDELRGRTRRERGLGGAPPSAPDASEPSVVADLLRRLGPKRRTAFVLTQLLGLGYEEAAIVCGCPTGTIRSRVARARAELVGLVDGGAGEAAGEPGSSKIPQVRSAGALCYDDGVQSARNA